jgi:hypothetical protein
MSLRKLSQGDYNIDVGEGNVSGISFISIMGHDDALTTTRTTIHPTATTLNIDQSAISATPAVVEVASTSADDALSGPGTGAHSVRVIGLDASGDAQTEVVDLTGTTEAATLLTFSAVTGLRVTAVGSGKKNAGTIWCGTGTFTGGVPAVKLASMDIAYNKAMTGYYVVPTGKTLYIKAISITTQSSTKKVGDVFIEQSTDGLFWVTEAAFGFSDASDVQFDVFALPGLAAGTHIRIEAVSTGTTEITAILGCELVDD